MATPVFSNRIFFIRGDSYSRPGGIGMFGMRSGRDGGKMEGWIWKFVAEDGWYGKLVDEIEMRAARIETFRKS